MRTKLLHISDLHFGPPYVHKVGQALLRTVASLGVDIVVASGDFTQRAKPQQFADARAFLDSLGQMPKVTVPGNHDVALWRLFERFMRPRELYQAYISRDLDQIHRFEGVTIVSLDSTSPRRSISNGRIHLDQLDFVAKAFESTANSDDFRVIVAHHHFAPAPDYERDQIMPKARRALDLFVELRVDLILGGHLHRAYIGNSLDVYPGADREHGIIIMQCGTSTSRRGRGREKEKNTFNLIELEQDMIHATHYMYFDDVDRFAPISRHAFPRPGRLFSESSELAPHVVHKRT